VVIINLTSSRPSGQMSVCIMCSACIQTYEFILCNPRASKSQWCMLVCILPGGVVLLGLMYTVRSIHFRTDFFLNNRTRAIYWPNHKVLSTNICSHTEFHLFMFDSVQVITCLVKSVFFIHHGWQK